jgi:hypothetical protein
MRKLIAFLVVAGIAISCKPGFATDPLPKGKSVVVLELFTSQGCSSCPPADRVLTKIGKDPDLAGRVIPLAYHVDYWDYIGWKDPFASELWSNRQRDYAHKAFETRRIYTPQIVINGRSHLVGSNASAVHQNIVKAAAAPNAAQISATRTPDGKGIKISATAVLGEDAAAPLRVVVVVYENKLTTRVTRGENTGRTLENDHIVRKLIGAGSVSGKAGSSVTVDTTVVLDPTWKAGNVGFVVMLQDPKSMAILGATSL